MAIVVAATDAKHGITKYSVTWVSDSLGDVSGMTFIMKVGTIMMVQFIPSIGPTAPDDLYDVDLMDENGVSMFDNGAGTTIGANLSAAASSVALPLFGTTGTALHRRWHPGGPVQPTVENAGDTNSGTINIYVLAGVL